MTMRFVDGDTNVSDFDPTRDIPNERFLHYSDGRSIKLERRNPYGLVYVVWHKGPTPESLSGSYTSFEMARTAVITYCNNNFPSGVKQVAHAVPPPVIEVKERVRKPMIEETARANG
jgi:hypothetical protein